MEERGEIDVGGRDMFICREYEFVVSTEKVRGSQICIGTTYEHHQTTLAITNGERTQDKTKDWGGGGGQKYIMLYQRHSFQRVAVMERRVSPLSTTAHRLSLLSCLKVWCAANRASSADPLTSTEDEHQQHVHKHQNRDHRKHRASLDIQGHGAALRADAEMLSVTGGISSPRLDT